LSESPVSVFCAVKDDDQSEEIYCIVTRADRQGEPEFICEAFESKGR